MAVFFHVSKDLHHNGIFEPTVPLFRYEYENDDIDRVSVGPTIEDCFTAIPGGGSYLEETNRDRRGYYLIFRIDTEKLKIDNNNIISSEELYEKELVPDSQVTNEYWITQNFTVPKEDRFLINLFYWDGEYEDVIPYSISKIASEKYDSDRVEAYIDIYKTSPNSILKISNLIYLSNILKENQELILSYNSKEEKDIISDTVNKAKDIFISNEDGLIKILAKKEVDLRDVFLNHYDYLINLGDI